MTALAEPLVVEVERSGLVESVHLVDVAVAAPDGSLRASAGDPGIVAYLRSAAKPIQAAVSLERGWAPEAEECLAVACASHNAEPAHLEAVRRTLRGAGLDEAALRCPPARPWWPADAAGVSAAPVHHNCSGKHAAMLAAARANDWPLETYRDPDHPLQRAVRDRIEGLAGDRALALGVDGCGVPTFAYSLAAAARAFAAFGDGGPAAARALAAMRAHPFLVAGTGRMCTAVLSAVPEVVVKYGAEGIVGGVVPGAAFCLKVRDGAMRAADAATLKVLGLLGAIGKAVPEALAPFLGAPVLGGGEPVGRVRCRGSMAGL